MKPDLKSQLHLKFLLPLLAVAAVGVAVLQLGLVDKLTGGDDTASAAEPALTEPAAGKPVAEPTPAVGEEATEGEETPAAPEKPTGMDQLEKALKKNAVVVVVVYAPEGQVDELAIAQARLGADDAKAGFLALDSSKEREVAEVATAFELRATPTLLVVKRGPNLANKVEGYADSTTVAQLVEDARRAA